MILSCWGLSKCCCGFEIDWEASSTTIVTKIANASKILFLELQQPNNNQQHCSGVTMVMMNISELRCLAYCCCGRHCFACRRGHLLWFWGCCTGSAALVHPVWTLAMPDPITVVVLVAWRPSRVDGRVGNVIKNLALGVIKVTDLYIMVLIKSTIQIYPIES
jgi:hypothetical protein